MDPSWTYRCVVAEVVYQNNSICDLAQLGRLEGHERHQNLPEGSI